MQAKMSKYVPKEVPKCMSEKKKLEGTLATCQNTWHKKDTLSKKWLKIFKYMSKNCQYLLQSIQLIYKQMKQRVQSAAMIFVAKKFFFVPNFFPLHKQVGFLHLFRCDVRTWASLMFKFDAKTIFFVRKNVFWTLCSSRCEGGKPHDALNIHK